MRKLDFDSVRIVPQFSNVSSRSEVSLNVNYSDIYYGLPVIVANMYNTGTFEMASALADSKINVCLHKHYPLSELTRFLQIKSGAFAWPSFGISDEDFNSIKCVNPWRLCIDVANGHMARLHDFIKKLKDWSPNLIIMAGNVGSPEGFELLAREGVSAVKAGIGNGGHCLSSNMTGIGYPQFALVQDCLAIAEETGVLLISDGGIREVGDICKGIGAGAHAVMCGSLFTGYAENAGEWRTAHPFQKDEQGKLVPFGEKQLRVYGMSSKHANETHSGGMKNYRAAEGRESWVAHKGELSELIQNIKGGLASSCAYQGFRSVQALRGNAHFVEI